MSDNNNHKYFPVGKKNLVIMAISFVIIIIGFVLMLGPNSDQAFNPDIFSPVRIGIAPMLCLAGYLLIIVGILKKTAPKDLPSQKK